MKLYELKRDDLFKLDLKDDNVNDVFGSDDIFRFEHVDGMYSFCYVVECPGNPEAIGSIAHIAAYAPVIKLPSSSG